MVGRRKQRSTAGGGKKKAKNVGEAVGLLGDERRMPPSPPASQDQPATEPEKKEKQKEEHVKVYVEVRAAEEAEGPLQVGDGEVRIPSIPEDGVPEKVLAVDRCWGPNADPSDVLKEVAAAAVASARSGHDSSVVICDPEAKKAHLANVLTRICLHIYHFLSESRGDFKMGVSMFELQGDRVRDLLRSTPNLRLEPISLETARVRWSPAYGPGVIGVLKREITSAADCAHTIASSSIRAGGEDCQTVFSMELVRCAGKGSEGGYVEKVSHVHVVDLGRAVVDGETGALSPVLNAVGKIVAGVVGSSSPGRSGSISFKLSAPDIAVISRENPVTHYLGEAFEGNTATLMYFAVDNSTARLRENATLLQIAAKARQIRNRLWSVSHTKHIVMSPLRAELCKLSAHDREAEGRHPTEDAVRLLDQQLRDLEKRQSEVDKLEKSIEQTEHLKQLAEYEKFQKERMQAEKRRVEDNARTLVLDARRAQQHVMDQFGRSEIQNMRLQTEKTSLEQTLDQAQRDNRKLEMQITALQQEKSALQRSVALEKGRAEAAQKAGSKVRQELLAENRRLEAELHAKQDEVRRAKMEVDEAKNELRASVMLQQVNAVTTESLGEEKEEELRRLQRDVKNLEIEKKTISDTNDLYRTKTEARYGSLAKELERQGVVFKKLDVAYRAEIASLNLQVQDLQKKLQAKEAEVIRELGIQQKKQEDLEMHLEIERQTVKEAKQTISSYKSNVESEWELEREALISSIETGCKLLADFIATMPDLKGSLDTMTAWLCDLGLERYTHLFQSHGITDMYGIVNLTDEMLEGMHITGAARKRLLQAVETVSLDSEKAASPASALYAWFDSLHFRLTGQPAPSTPLQEYLDKKPPPPRVTRTPPAFHQVRTASGYYTNPQKKEPRHRRYVEKNEVLLSVGDSRSSISSVPKSRENSLRTRTPPKKGI